MFTYNLSLVLIYSLDTSILIASPFPDFYNKSVLVYPCESNIQTFLFGTQARGGLGFVL